MRLLYIANHGQVVTSNDDEGAIAHAFEKLGHEVVCVHERDASSLTGNTQHVDLCLFHKYDNWDVLGRLTMPIVFWYFDQVYNRAQELSGRSLTRMKWMRNACEVADLGFLTDGDWIDDHNRTGDLHWLPQGADERIVGRAPPFPSSPLPPDLRIAPILFCGLEKGCGERRESFVNDMRLAWGNRFCHIARGAHGPILREIVGRATVVLASDFPVTDKYWSNRVYLMAGFGACVVHPICARLDSHFVTTGDFLELMPYHDRYGLLRVVGACLSSPHLSQEIGARALARVKREHLYRHRCKQLLAIVKEKLHV